MARWEALQKAKYASESRSLDRDIGSAEDTETKKSAYSGVGGMIGAIGLPLAFSAMTGGMSMALPTLMAAVGIGSFGGRAIGSALGGKSKDIGSGTFLKGRRSEAQSLIDQAGTKRRKDILWGAVKDAGTAGFVKAGGLDAFKEIGAKGLTKLVGEKTASNLYKASGMMATNEEFSTLLEGTKTRDMWSNLGFGKKLSYGQAGDVRELGKGTFASVSDEFKKGMSAKEFAKKEIRDNSSDAGRVGARLFGNPYDEKAMALGQEKLGKLAREQAEGTILKDVKTGRKLFPGNPYDEEALHQSQAKHLFRSPMQKPTSTPIENAQNTLNQKVSMYNQATGGANISGEKQPYKSIVNYLTDAGQDSSITNRKELFNKFYGDQTEYTGTMRQNEDLLGAMTDWEGFAGWRKRS